MPAEILHESSPGLFTVALPDGRQVEMPLDLAQQTVQASYADDPGATQYAPQGAPAPQVAVPQAAPPVDPAVDPNAQGFGPEFFEAAPAGGQPAPAPADTGSEAEITMEPLEVGSPAPQGPVSPEDRQGALAAPYAAANSMALQGATRQFEGEQGIAEQEARGARLQAALAAGAEPGLDDVVNMSWEERQAFDAAQEAQRLRDREIAIQQKARQQAEVAIQQAVMSVPQTDPGRVWRNAGVFGSAMGILSAGIGGWMQVMKGGPNHALQAIMDLVQQDVRAQEVDIQTAREKVYRMERAYDRTVATGESELLRRDQEILKRLSALSLATQAEAAKYKSWVSQGKLMQFAGQLQQGMAEVQERIFGTVYNQIMRETEFEESVRARQAQEALTRRGQNMSFAATKRGQDQAMLRDGWVPDGKGGWKRDPMVLEQLRVEMEAKRAQSAAAAAKAGAELEDTTLKRAVFNPVTGEPIIDKRTGKPARMTGTESQIAETAERQQAAIMAAEVLMNLRQLMEEAGDVTSWWGTGSEIDRRVQAMHKEFVSLKVLARSGKAATDAERQAVADTNPIEALLRPDTDKILADRQEELIKDVDSLYKARGVTADVRNEIFGHLVPPEPAPTPDTSTLGMAKAIKSARDPSVVEGYLTQLTDRIENHPNELMDPDAVTGLRTAVFEAAKRADELEAAGNRADAVLIRLEISRLKDAFGTHVRPRIELDKKLNKLPGQRKTYPDQIYDLSDE